LNPDFEERIAGDPSSARYPIQVLLGMTFCTLMVSNLGMILCNRSKTKSVFAMFKVFNPALYIIVPCAFVALLLCLYIPGLRNLFHSDVIPAKYLFESIGAGLIPALLSEVVKMGIFIIRNEG
jgi:Ca2+-transporting ATPase